MPFSDEDKILIKHYRLDKRYGRKRLLAEFPEKNWKAGGLDKLIQKIDVTGSVGRLRGSGRPKSARTEENIEIVEELVQSQEEPGTHKSPREIERETGISRSTVRRIAKNDLQLNQFKRVKGQKLSTMDEKKRRKRVPLLLKKITKKTLSKTFFTDEKIFTVDTPRMPVCLCQKKKRNCRRAFVYNKEYFSEEIDGLCRCITTRKNVNLLYRSWRKS